MSKLNIYNEISTSDWNKFLLNSTYASPFQTKEFYSFLKEYPLIDASLLILSVNDKIKAIVLISIMKESGIMGFFSKRGIIFGGPVLSDDISPEELEFFLKEVSRQMKWGSIYLETRNFFDYSAHKQAFINVGWYYEPYLNFQLSLQNVNKVTLPKLFKYNRRREIKQSIAEGATYRLCANEKEVEEVYGILLDLYITKVKLPIPSLLYFLNLYRAQIAKVFVVKHQGKTIGGSICPYLEKKAIYTYYYCGIRDYHKKIFPTHLAVLAAIEYAIDNNIPIIDFMGAGKPGDQYGVRNYKSQFGGQLVEHGRFIKIQNPFMYKIGKLGLKILSKF